jgi:DNA (cytosine-5)-methyltransferase 1
MGTMRRGNGNVTGGVPFIAQPLTAREGKGADSNASSGNMVTHALTAEGSDASEDGTGRGTPLMTIGFGETGGGQTGVSAGAVRRLTPVECERLQGFPDSWTATSYGKPQSDSARYRQLGNSIAVPVFAWVAARIVAYEAASAGRGDHADTLDT